MIGSSMIEFRPRFIAQFPAHLQAQMLQFAAFVNGLQQSLRESPTLQWPPPTDLREQFDYFVELALQANAAKGTALCSGIVGALNENNFLSVAVLIRAFFEQVLLIREYWTEQLLPVISKCASAGQVGPGELQDLIAKLHSSVRRSRIDWENFLAGKLDSLEDKEQMDNVGLLRAAKAWTTTGKKLGIFTPSELYNVLCDFAHPNFGSALLCFSGDGVRFADAFEPTVGLKAFGVLHPSLASLAMELKQFLAQLELVKFKHAN
jgi:hypothetical protein